MEEAELVNITWNEMVSDEVSRSEIPLKHRRSLESFKFPLDKDVKDL